MKREQLEHILRASAAITGHGEFVIVGSQAILGQFPNAPEEFLRSQEADVFSLDDPHAAELIDGSIGEQSPFHTTFGYFAHGVGEETAVLPDGWKDRLIRVNSVATQHATGLCLEVHDLAISKLVAGRDKDLAFITGLVRHGMALPAMLRARLDETPMARTLMERCHARLEHCLHAAGTS